MLARLLILFFFYVSIVAINPVFAQQIDSAKLKKLDSLDTQLKSKTDRIFRKSDSLQQKVSNKLNAVYDFKVISPKIKNPSLGEKSKTKFDSSKKALAQKLDNSSKLDIPTKKYSSFLDSLNKIGSAKRLKQAEEGLQKAEKRIAKPFDKISKSVNDRQKNVNTKLAELNKEGADLPSNVAIPSKSINLSEPSIPTLPVALPKVDTQLPTSLSSIKDASKLSVPTQLKEVEMLKSNAKKVTTMPDSELSALKKKAGVDVAKSELTAVKDISEKAKTYTKDAENVVKGNLKEVKELPKALESQVSGKVADDVKVLQNQTNVLKEYNTMLTKGFDKDDIKKLAETSIDKQTVNHFAGKEKELTAALEQMSKYKLRYPTATEVRDITKGVRNEMTGKSFRQRALVGFNLQFQTRSDFIVDVNPWAGFRLSGKWVAGLGWVERFQFNSVLTTASNGRMYGPRIFTDIKWKKGIAARGEVELVNAYMPNVSTQDNGRVWLFGYFAGLKKDYKFSKKVKSNFQVMYNLSHYINKASPYPNKLNIRMGFEFGYKRR